MQKIDAGKAVDLFESFRKSGLLMAGGNKSGCHWRAELITEELTDKTGLPVKKIWCWGEDITKREAFDPYSATIAFTPSYDPDEDVYNTVSNFHVAPVLEAERPLIFDPAYYDGPVTPEQWQRDFIPFSDKKLVVTLAGPDLNSVELRDRAFSLTSSFGFAATARKELERKFSQSPGDEIIPYGRSQWLQRHKCLV